MQTSAAMNLPKIASRNNAGRVRIAEVKFPATFKDNAQSYSRLGLFKFDPTLKLAEALGLDSSNSGIQIPEGTSRMESIIAFRLQGLELPRYCSFMLYVAKQATLNDPRQRGLFKMAMAMELEHLPGHISFWEKHRNDRPLCSGYSPAGILKILLQAAQGGCYSSSDTPARDQIGRWITPLLKKANPEVIRQAKSGTAQTLWWRYECRTLDMLAEHYRAQGEKSELIRDLKYHFGNWSGRI